MIDLIKIAETEAAGGNLEEIFDGIYEKADLRPNGYPDAIVWKGGNHNSDINPIAHSLTDAFALLGTVSAIDVLGLPFYALPMLSLIHI